MGDVVNLNKARKAAAKAAERAGAISNRVVHGRSKAERETASAQTQAAARELDGKKRET